MFLFESKIRGLMGSVEKSYLDAVQSKRIEQSKMLYDFYSNDCNEIINILKKRMVLNNQVGIFKQKTIDRIPAFNYINPIPKVIDQLCTAYKEEPVRYIGEDEENKLLNLFYTYVNRFKYNKVLQETEKLADLFGYVYVMPIIRNDKIELDILYPFQIETIYEEDNPNKLKEIAILNHTYNTEKQEIEKYITIWNNEEYFIYDCYLNKKPIIINGKSNEYKNPFGFIPVIELRFNDTNRMWLIEHAIDLSIHQIWLSYATYFQVGGIATLTNYEPEPNYYSEDVKLSARERRSNNIESETRIAPDSILILNNSDPAKEAKFNYVSPQSNIQNLSAFEEWKKKNLFSDLNINPNLASFTKVAESGYSKMMDELETINVRQQHLNTLRDFENELFQMICLILDIELGAKISGELSIDFAEIHFPKSIKEKAEERKLQLELNIKTPIDFILEENPDLNWEQAKEIYEENKKINQGGLTFDMQEDMSNGMENEMEFDIPDLRQWSDYDCGVSALNSILQYYGIDYNGEELSKELGTTKDYGTDENMIVSVAEKNGLEVDKREMTIDILKEFLSKKIPVILDIQAWHGTENYDYTNEYNDGHYVVAKGFDNENILIEDPSSIGTAKMSYQELEKRWHDIDKDNNKLQNLGIAVIGTPKERGFESIG